MLVSQAMGDKGINGQWCRWQEGCWVSCMHNVTNTETEEKVWV